MLLRLIETPKRLEMSARCGLISNLKRLPSHSAGPGMVMTRNRSPRNQAAKTTLFDANRVHASYITHHNGPQYFWLYCDIPSARATSRIEDFHDSLRIRRFPNEVGSLREGGYRISSTCTRPILPRKYNATSGATTTIPICQTHKSVKSWSPGPSTDIAASPYWPHSAIISPGTTRRHYDHVPAPTRVTGQTVRLRADGPRVPLILISPYARNTLPLAHEQGKSCFGGEVHRYSVRSATAGRMPMNTVRAK